MEDIENLENFNSLSPELRQLHRLNQYQKSGDFNKEPRGAIDSINSLNNTFVNRMPQFSSSHTDWKVELLPLYAQAANLHLVFLRDVVKNATDWGLTPSQIQTYKNRLKEKVIEYSNYCLKIYGEAFDKLESDTFQNRLDFRNFMVFNVLDYVSSWSMLRYEGILVNSSANIYLSDGVAHSSNSTRWPAINQFLQGKPYKIFSGLSSKGFTLEVT
ncbi:insecticidal delta-endotoxin Cry8Ea1 family protein [Bacillus cereus]|uniref:insecticidal delta-endotoxin Cry8Ea1 family protein n=1 Tax=Bacillus cereus TaxID=1396 RepID=UPI0003131189|nr:insecticidal delta-endotoxin Cry8Ea1 family protein [Bacillus cereus]MDR4293909.1 hypothetical protein [Bacillus cereus]